ncbi:MAG: hypothetical protein ABII18_10365 [bacterium]
MKTIKIILLTCVFVLSFNTVVVAEDTAPLNFYRAGGAGAGEFSIDNRMGGSNSDVIYQALPDGSGTGGHAFYVNNGSGLQFSMGMDRSGHVGIGTTTPEASLHVYSDITPIKFYRTGGGGGASFSIDNRLSGDGSDVVYTAEPNGSGHGGHVFYVNNGTSSLYAMGIDQNGNVAIGTPNSKGYKLAVEGTLGARELIVSTESWSDYVFEEDYQLKPLADVAKYIKTNKHLPEIPSAEKVIKDGVNVIQIQRLLLKKIEELTLYTIEQDKRIAELESEGGRL